MRRERLRAEKYRCLLECWQKQTRSANSKDTNNPQGMLGHFFLFFLPIGFRVRGIAFSHRLFCISAIKTADLAISLQERHQMPFVWFGDFGPKCSIQVRGEILSDCPANPVLYLCLVLRLAVDVCGTYIISVDSSDKSSTGFIISESLVLNV